MSLTSALCYLARIHAKAATTVGGRPDIMKVNTGPDGAGGAAASEAQTAVGMMRTAPPVHFPIEKSQRRSIMKLKIAALAAALSLTATLPSMAIVLGGSNLDFMGYPQSRAYISFDPDEEELRQYLDEIDEYVENCDNDIRRILEARNNAIEEARQKVRDYHRHHGL